MKSVRIRVSTVLFASFLIAAPAGAQQGTVRVIQTNAAGDDVHIIDPETNEVVDVLLGIPIAHGVSSHPDGTEYYFSNEVEAHARRPAFTTCTSPPMGRTWSPG